MKSPINYYGGKSKLVNRLLPLIPPHNIYVEVFGGAANLLFAKEPSRVEVYNDIEENVVNFFSVLRDPVAFARLYFLAMSTPYSRQEFYMARDSFNSEPDNVVRAWKYLITSLQSYDANLRTWGLGVGFAIQGIAKGPALWMNGLSHLALAFERFRRVQIEHSDFERIFSLYDSQETFFYCDPPYIESERRSLGVYLREMDIEDHKRFLKCVQGIHGKVLISGYENELYNNELASWHKKMWKVFSTAGNTN
ncbi:MAG: DNA adenine methylase, partial [Bacteroidota bacterium]